jgi:branched-chain amino acid transport system ATP-binding protein
MRQPFPARGDTSARRVPRLAVEALSCRYGAIQALWDVAFEVYEGEVVALVGSNGAGKTSALRTVAGLLKPETGSIRVDRVEMVGRPPHELVARGISLVPEGRRLWPGMTVLEHLELGAYHRAARARSRERLEWVFSVFPRLRERAGQMAGTMSGGEQQMLAIGRALMAEPKLLMLDEPSLGLAPQVVTELLHVVVTLGREGVTLLIVEQNVHLALGVADHGYVIENGRIIAGGRADDLLADETIREAYLGL